MVTTCLPAGSWRAFSPTAVIPNMIPLLILLMSTRLLSSVASKKLSPTIISLRVTVFVTLCVSNKVPVILSMILPYPISLLLLIIIWFVLTVTPAWVRLPTMTLLPYWKWIVFTWAAHLQETLALSIMILGGIAILPRLSFVFSGCRLYLLPNVHFEWFARSPRRIWSVLVEHGVSQPPRQCLERVFLLVLCVRELQRR